MPRYKCHKIVRALQIKFVAVALNGQQERLMFPTDKRYAPLKLAEEWCLKHKPEAGGYYVLYDDGYASYSPAKAFEAGYTYML